MDLFRKKQRMAAILVNFKGLREKLKDGATQDGARARMVLLGFEVKIDNTLREALPPKIQNIVTLDGTADRQTDVNALEIAKDEQTCVFKIFSKSNFSPKATALVVRGGGDREDPAKVVLKKIIRRDQDSIMAISVRAPYGKDLWDWLGDNFGETDCVLQFDPLQAEMDFEKAEEGEKKGKKETAAK